MPVSASPVRLTLLWLSVVSAAKATRQDIVKMHADRKASGAAAGSANRLLIMMRYIFNLALKWEVAGVKANPCKGVSDVRVHDLRHAHASFLINAGRTLYEVQQILGHTQVKTTQRYAHLSQDTLLAAANAATAAVGAVMLPVVQPVQLAA